MPENVLDQCLITPEVWQAWVLAALESCPLPTGITQAMVPDEQAEALPDGRLRLHVTMPDGTVLLEMFVPPEHWCWTAR